MQELYVILEKLVGLSYIMFMNKKFYYYNSDPTSSSYCFPLIRQSRERLIEYCFSDMK
jgi:hypothetical protein